MSVRMSNLDNERDDRDEDSHEDRGISEYAFHQTAPCEVIGPQRHLFCPLPVSNTRFIAAVIERHTHTPERRRRYWGRSGTESDHGRNMNTRRSWSNKPSSPLTHRRTLVCVLFAVFPLPVSLDGVSGSFGPPVALAPVCGA